MLQEQNKYTNDGQKVAKIHFIAYLLVLMGEMSIKHDLEKCLNSKFSFFFLCVCFLGFLVFLLRKMLLCDIISAFLLFKATFPEALKLNAFS